MKKIIISVIALWTGVLLVCGVSLANEPKSIQALDESFPIFLNDSDIPWFVPMVTIYGHSYVQTRAFCEMFGIGVEWESEGRKIRLETAKEESTKFEFGLTEKAALKYIEAIFQDCFTQEYLENMKIFITHDGGDIQNALHIMKEKVSDPDQYYFGICMANDIKKSDGREFMAVIKKSDGQIIEVIETH